VSIAGTNKIFDVEENEILYDALFDRGEELPHGCLAGSCGACRIEVTSGVENLSEPGFIEKNTIEALKDEITAKFGKNRIENKTIRLSCRAKIIRGDVSFKPLKID
jgi:ferredoxin